VEDWLLDRAEVKELTGQIVEEAEKDEKSTAF
jgi:hypothetical protein